jgi:branched-subunit amino acid ABC-type transport system permease component
MYLISIILQNLVLGTQILMVAVGLYLVHAASRIVHLATGAIGAASAYALYFGITAGWPLFTAILFAIAIALVLGILSAKILEPFAERHEPLLGLLVSFAFGMIIESLIAIFFGTDGKSFQSGILPVAVFGGVELDVPGIVTIVLGVVLAIGTWAILEFSKIGRVLRSIAENSAVATSLGVNNKMIRRLTYCGAAIAAAVVIILTGWHTALTPLMGFQLIIAAFIALLMGGVHDIRGAVVASYSIALIPGLVIGFSEGLSENWRLVFVFCIAAVVLALRPDGIFSKQIRDA